MYSDSTVRFLEGNDLEPGSKARLVYKGREYEGTVMPRSRQGDQDAVVLKLENGYNAGFDPENIEEIEKIGEIEGTEDTSAPEGKEAGDLDLVILHTGGTIASKVSYSEGGVKPSFSSDDLLSMYPELLEEASIETEPVFQVASESMEPEHWQKLAEKVSEHRHADGIVIGHGTDTMQYTASALSFMLENIGIPVVIVGAQRSSDRPSTDAAVNLLSAVEFIKKGVPGVFVCMHSGSSDTEAAVHIGTRVRKMHTSRRDAFRSVGSEPLAEVSYPEGEVEFNFRPEEYSGEFNLRNELDTDVALLKIFPGMEMSLFEGVEDKKGLIIEGTGLGHVPADSFDEHTEHHEEFLEKISEVADEGVVAMTSQCLHGRVNLNVYDPQIKLQERGVISSENMLPGTAYVKLMWSLGQTDTIEEAEELFRQNVAGEIQDREKKSTYEREN